MRTTNWPCWRLTPGGRPGEPASVMRGSAMPPSRPRPVRRLTAVSVRIPGPPELLPGCPDAIIDLQTAEGAALAGWEWRYTATRLREPGLVSGGPALGPSGPPNRTYEVVPRAH